MSTITAYPTGSSNNIPVSWLQPGDGFSFQDNSTSYVDYEFYGFDFSGIPADSSILGVTVEYGYCTSRTGLLAYAKAAASKNSGSAYGSYTTVRSGPSKTFVDISDSLDISLTLAELQSFSGFRVKIAIKGSYSRGLHGSCKVDYLRVTVNYGIGAKEVSVPIDAVSAVSAAPCIVENTDTEVSLLSSVSASADFVQIDAVDISGTGDVTLVFDFLQDAVVSTDVYGDVTAEIEHVPNPANAEITITVESSVDADVKIIREVSASVDSDFTVNALSVVGIKSDLTVDHRLIPSGIRDARSRVMNELIHRMGTIDITPLLIYIIDSVTETALPHLIEQFHVSGNEGGRLAENATNRRQLLKKAIALHRLKGTPAGIKQVIYEAGFGDVTVVEYVAEFTLYNAEEFYNGSVTYGRYSTEWAEYSLIVSRAVTSDQAVMIRALCKEFAPVRCHLKSIAYAEAALRYNGEKVYDGTNNFGTL